MEEELALRKTPPNYDLNNIFAIFSNFTDERDSGIDSRGYRKIRVWPALVRTFQIIQSLILLSQFFLLRLEVVMWLATQ